MEFSEISELNCLLGIARSPRRKLLMQSREHYIEYVRDCPIENLLNPSPYYPGKGLGNNVRTRDSVTNSESEYSLDRQSDVYSKSENTSEMDNSISYRSKQSMIDSFSPHEFAQEIVNALITRAINETFDQQAVKPYRCNSVMTHLMQTTREYRSKSAVYIVPPMESDPCRQSLVVYLLDTKYKLEITVSKGNTIGQITIHVFYLCLYGDSGYPIALPYNSFEGYELRLLDDDMPLYEIAPLDPSKEIGGFRIDAVGFCAKKDYVSPKKIRNLKDANEIHMEKIAVNQNKLLVKIHMVIGLEECITALTLKREETLELVLRKLSIKRGMNFRPEHYQLQYYNETQNFTQTADRILNYKDEANLNALSVKLPVKDLKSRELLLISKYFVDFPKRKASSVQSGALSLSLPQAIQTKKVQALFHARIPEHDLSEDEILLNEITATVYKVQFLPVEENFGMKQARVLGLDRYFLYNEKRKNGNKYMNTLLPELFVKTATTVRPMIRIEDISRVERNKEFPKRFVVEYLLEDHSEAFNYEAKTVSEAAEIVARIKYLIVLFLLLIVICRHSISKKQED